MANTRETEATLLTFIAGAAIGAGIALLLNKDVRGKVGYETEEAVRKLLETLHKIPGFPPPKPIEGPDFLQLKLL